MLFSCIFYFNVILFVFVFFYIPNVQPSFSQCPEGRCGCTGLQFPLSIQAIQNAVMEWFGVVRVTQSHWK